MELERQRLELERQKLELERSKLEFEKAKDEEKSKKQEANNTLVSTPSTSINIAGLVASVLMALSCFLPWVGVSASGFGVSGSSSVSGVQTTQGIIVLLCAAASTILFIKRNRYVYIPGAIAFLMGVSIIAGIGSYSISSFGVSGRSGFSIGPIITVISAIIVSLSPYINVNNSGVKSINLVELIRRYRVELLLFLASILVLFPTVMETNYFISVIEFIFILCFFGVPFAIYKYLKMTYSSKMLFALASFLVIVFINGLLKVFLDSYQNSAFANNFNESIFWGKYVFFILFYPLLVLTTIRDYRRLKGLSPPPFRGKEFISKPYFSQFVVLIPLVGFFSYYSLTRTFITSKDIEHFIEINRDLNGTWYYLNEDKTYILEFTISSRSDVYQNEFEDTLNLFIDVWGANPINNEPFQFSTVLRGQYQQKIQTPINLKNFISIEKITSEKLVFSFNKQASNRIIAMSNKENLFADIAETSEENYIDSEENYPDLDSDEYGSEEYDLKNGEIISHFKVKLPKSFKVFKNDGSPDYSNFTAYTDGVKLIEFNALIKSRFEATTIEEFYENAISKSGLKITYKTQKSNWFVISGTDKETGKIVYWKRVIGENYVSDMYISYEESHKSLIESHIGDIAKTFTSD